MNDANLSEFCRRNSIELLVLFGSTATGGVDQASDVDLAVRLQRGAPERKLELLDELGELFGDREIDLVVLTPDTDPVLLREIFTGGRPLYEGRPGLFDDERLRAHKLYFDTEKLRAHRDAFLRRFSESVRHVA
jgi:predicted nucleotidyltransferase